jgi:hypothetical protein
MTETRDVMIILLTDVILRIVAVLLTAFERQ